MAKKASKKKAKKSRGTTEKAGRGPKLTLRLDAAFYPRAAVVRAAGAFSHLASIRVRREGSQHVIEFSGMAADIAPRLPDEFANYVMSCAVIEP